MLLLLHGRTHVFIIEKLSQKLDAHPSDCEATKRKHEQCCARLLCYTCKTLYNPPPSPNQHRCVLLILTFLAGVRTMGGAGVGMMAWGKGVKVCWWVCWWVCWC